MGSGSWRPEILIFSLSTAKHLGWGDLFNLGVKGLLQSWWFDVIWTATNCRLPTTWYLLFKDCLASPYQWRRNRDRGVGRPPSPRRSKILYKQMCISSHCASGGPSSNLRRHWSQYLCLLTLFSVFKNSGEITSIICVSLCKKSIKNVQNSFLIKNFFVNYVVK